MNYAWMLAAQIPMLVVILWLLKQLTKTERHLKEYADKYGELAGHDIIQARNYVRAMSKQTADAEERAHSMRRRRGPIEEITNKASIEDEVGSMGS